MSELPHILQKSKKHALYKKVEKKRDDMWASGLITIQLISEYFYHVFFIEIFVILLTKR